MATTKPAAKKAAPAKKSTSTAVVPWQEEMAARANKAAKAVKVQSITKKISTAGGVLSVDDEVIEGNELRVIIVGATPENQYYDRPYDPKNPTVPVCYSFGDPSADEPGEGMVPHAEAEAPQGTDDPDNGSADGNCADCWANRMGTADVGRGKACKNIYRVAVVTEDALESAEALADAEVRMVNVPVMSVRNFATFVHKIADDMQRPPEAVVALLKVVPDPKSQFQVKFSFEELINFDQDLYEAMTKKVAEVAQQLVLPYPKQSELEAQQQPVRPRGRMAQAMARGGKGGPSKPAAKTAGRQKF